MGEYGRKQRNQLSRIIANIETGSRQLKGFVDSRRVLMKQQKNMIEHTIQCAAHIDSSASEHKYCRVLSVHTWDRSARTVVFKSVPGFGQNHGELKSDIYNSDGGGHSEPNLISKEYGGTRGDWDTADSAVDAANKKEGGRDSFNLYTEREPCNICNSHLANDDLYSEEDKINWSVPYSGDHTGAITLLYVDQADSWLAQNYSSMAQRKNWRKENIGGAPRLVCDY